MTETQGDYLGCLIVLIGIVPLLLAVHHAGHRRQRAVAFWIMLSAILSVIGVAVVILT
jgi:hypothetical protein